MRSIINRTLGAVAVTAAAVATVFVGAGSAQAANSGVTCVYNPNPVCHWTAPGPHSNDVTFATSTQLDVTPEPAVYSGVGHSAVAPNVSVHGMVRTLSSAGNTSSKAGSVRIYFVRSAVTSTPVFMGTATVSSTGAFSKAVRAPYTGTWRVLYSGNSVRVNSTRYSHMLASTSNGDAVIVRKVTRAAGTLRFAAESAGRVSSFTTDNYGFTPGRPVSLYTRITNCTAPTGSFTSGIIRDGGASTSSVGHSSDDVNTQRTDVFSAGAATAGFISGLDADCNVTMTLTQQRPAQFVQIN